MNGEVFGPVNQGIETANSMAEMSSCAIWAALALFMFLYLVWKTRSEIITSGKWRVIREQQIASETAQTEVLRRQTEEIVSMKMMLTKLTTRE